MSGKSLSQNSRFRPALQQFALAMLNATLMLGIILVVLSWLLFGRIQGFAADASSALHDALAPQAERLERIAASIESLEAQVAQGDGLEALRSEVAGLRSEIVNIREGIKTARQIGPQLLAERAMEVIGKQLIQNDRAAR